MLKINSTLLRDPLRIIVNEYTRPLIFRKINRFCPDFPAFVCISTIRSKRRDLERLWSSGNNVSLGPSKGPENTKIIEKPINIRIPRLLCIELTRTSTRSGLESYYELPWLWNRISLGPGHGPGVQKSISNKLVLSCIPRLLYLERTVISTRSGLGSY